MKNWWKIASVLLISYSIVMGFLGDVPKLPILNETIRNLYFHVVMWFAMLGMMTGSIIHSIKVLSNSSRISDIKASQFAETGMVFASLGLITGMIWANFTWGSPWTNDPKLNGTAITMIIYLAYFILRGSLEDPENKARISAVYNIFAFVLMIVFIGILPRLTDSLHPGNGGNPGFNNYDMDSSMRMVFYPACIGWILFGIWVSQVKIKFTVINDKFKSSQNEIYDSIQ